MTERSSAALSRFSLFRLAEIPEQMRPSLLRAMAEINARSPGRHSPEQMLQALERNLLNDGDNHFAIVALDEGRLVGFCGVDVFQDQLGVEFASLTYGWMAKDQRGAPFDAVLPVIESWAMQRGLDRLVSMTKRDADAYERWIGARGFRRAETMFVKELPQ